MRMSIDQDRKPALVLGALGVMIQYAVGKFAGRLNDILDDVDDEDGKAMLDVTIASAYVSGVIDMGHACMSLCMGKDVAEDMRLMEEKLDGFASGTYHDDEGGEE